MVDGGGAWVVLNGRRQEAGRQARQQNCHLTGIKFGIILGIRLGVELQFFIIRYRPVGACYQML